MIEFVRKNGLLKKTVVCLFVFVFVFSGLFGLIGISKVSAQYGGSGQQDEHIRTMAALYSDPLITCGTFDLVCHVGDFLLDISSYVLYAGAVIFNQAMKYTVLEAYKVIDVDPAFSSRPTLKSSIRVGWIKVRDFINILFLFELLWISIATILQISSFNAKSMLLKVILAALLTNYSLFVTRVMFDLSNLIAVEFYNCILFPGTCS
jgi:hypothetical protein